jgi:ribosomal protein S18 acetylase RimI-like enzyme
MDLLIRTATAADLDPAGAVTVEAFVGDGHTHSDSPYVSLLADAARRAAEAELLVAVDPADLSTGPTGRVLGCVTFAVGGTEWADIATPSEGEIRMLAASAVARGRGVGEALVRACVQRSRDLGLTGMAFSTRPGMKAAHRIYERVGFRRAPERDWCPRPEIELWVYAMSL